MKSMVRFWIGSGGALLCDQEIPSVTQEITGETAEWYGGKWFIGESITRIAGETIAKALGGEFIDNPREKDSVNKWLFCVDGGADSRNCKTEAGDAK